MLFKTYIYVYFNNDNEIRKMIYDLYIKQQNSNNCLDYTRTAKYRKQFIDKLMTYAKNGKTRMVLRRN